MLQHISEAALCLLNILEQTDTTELYTTEANADISVMRMKHGVLWVTILTTLLGKRLNNRPALYLKSGAIVILKRISFFCGCEY
jgi:hypothetical protein